MPRLARVVVPGMPHHVIQRGNRRQPVFFQDADYRFYLHLLKKESEKSGTEVWAWCLMPNHVHLVLVPSHEDGLRATLAEAHRQYTKMVNERERWGGYLWQGRFQSYPMDEGHLLQTVRYIELNPVRAGMVASPEDYPWSSARAHLAQREDGVCRTQPVLDLVDDYVAYLAEPVRDEELERIQHLASTGRPAGDKEFIQRLEEITGRRLQKRKPGRRGKK